MSEGPRAFQQDFVDAEHLKLLAIFHYVVGGMVVLFASIFIIHVAFGIAIAIDPQILRDPQGRAVFPPFVAVFMAIFAGLFVLAGWTLGGITIYSGRCLQKRKRRLFSLVVAGIDCLFFPCGTILGAFTIIVLVRDSVRKLYGE
ncbi:MAG: hypothetical protein WD063_01405 [Pirellulales bacterium]